MKTPGITIYLDTQTKLDAKVVEDAEKVCNEYGLTFTEVIVMFCEAIVNWHRDNPDAVKEYLHTLMKEYCDSRKEAYHGKHDTIC